MLGDCGFWLLIGTSQIRNLQRLERGSHAPYARRRRLQRKFPKRIQRCLRKRTPLTRRRRWRKNQQNRRSIHHSGIRFGIHNRPLFTNRIRLTNLNNTLLLDSKGTMLTSHILLTQRALLCPLAARVIYPSEAKLLDGILVKLAASWNNVRKPLHNDV